MKNKKERRYRSIIARNNYVRYILTLLGSMAAVAVLYGLIFLAAVSIYFSLGLNEYYITYNLAHGLLEQIPVILIVTAIIIWIVVTYLSMRRLLRYLDEVVDAAAMLAGHSEEPILLSDELKQVQDNLNQVRETARRNEALSKEAEQRKNDLVVYLAHDLKTPLASVIGYLNLLQDEKDISPELREKYLGITLDKAGRLEDLINEFFEIARFNLSDIPLQYGKVNLTRLFEQMVYEFQPLLDEKQLHCRLELADNVILRCDADKLERAFDNLLRNAVIYSYEGTEILIRMQVRQDYTQLRQEGMSAGAQGRTQERQSRVPAGAQGRMQERQGRMPEAKQVSLSGKQYDMAQTKQISQLETRQDEMMKLKQRNRTENGRNHLPAVQETRKKNASMETVGAKVVLDFVNHGDTIPQEKLGRIFEQFYRVDSSRSSSLGGAGLGLAIAKQIIEKHQGTITAQSANEVIRFHVELPMN